MTYSSGTMNYLQGVVPSPTLSYEKHGDSCEVREVTCVTSKQQGDANDELDAASAAGDASRHSPSGELHTFPSSNLIGRPPEMVDIASTGVQARRASSCLEDKSMTDNLLNVPSRRKHASYSLGQTTDQGIPRTLSRVLTLEKLFGEQASKRRSSSIPRLCSCPLLFDGGPPAGNCPHMPRAKCSLDPNDPSLQPEPIKEQIWFPYTPQGRWRAAYQHVRHNALSSTPDNASARISGSSSLRVPGIAKGRSSYQDDPLAEETAVGGPDAEWIAAEPLVHEILRNSQSEAHRVPTPPKNHPVHLLRSYDRAQVSFCNPYLTLALIL